MGNGNAGVKKEGGGGGNQNKSSKSLPAAPTTPRTVGNNKQPLTARRSIQRKVTQHVPGALVTGTSEWNLNQALLGNPKVAVKNNPDIVRIFLSSTFTDTRHERNALMENVFPKLKSYCQNRGYSFQVVDMRWGVRDEATDDHLTTELCLKEIEACINVSAGPNFVSLLSHKYGYRPFPRKIPAEEFTKILSACSPSESYILEQWFHLDENAIPPEYILQPISKNIPDYKSKDMDVKNKANAKWWDTFENIQKIIKNTVNKVLPKRAHHYTMSVTEREITHGIVQQKEAYQHCFAISRTIEDIDKAEAKGILAKYYECKGTKPELEETHRLMNQLREKTVPSKLPGGQMLKYTVPWTDGGIDPEHSQKHKAYIEQFCRDFESKLVPMIDAGIQKEESQEINSELYIEIVQHYRIYRQKCGGFSGRQDVMQRLETYVTGRSAVKEPLILHGPSGCGKTAVLSLAAQNAYPWTGGNCATVFRFLGTTRSSSSLIPLLKSLIDHISRVYEKRIQPAKSLRELVKQFHKALSMAKPSQPLILILDSLDQLDASDGGRHLHWLPPVLPAGVKLIMSTLPDEKYQAYQRCQGLYRKASSYLEVPLMDEHDQVEVLENWLSSDKRTLQPQQRETLIQAFRSCAIPLYLKLTYREAIRWHSYDPPSETRLNDTITDTIDSLLWRIERKHGSLLVGHALGCLTATQSGISENELEDLLSLSDDVLNDVYQYWTPPVRRLPPLLWVRIKSELSEYLIERGTDNMQVITWHHRQFVEVARKRYLYESDEIFRYHIALSEFFLGIWADRPKPFVNKKGIAGAELRYVKEQPLKFENGDYNLRKLHQLPYHLINARELKVLKTHVLFNYDFLVAKMAATSFTSVIQDFRMARAAFPTDKDLRVLTETLQLSQEALSFDTSELAGQLLGRIHGTGSSSLLSQAQEALAQGLLPDAAIPVLSLLEALEEQEIEKNKHINKLLQDAKSCKVPNLVPDRGFLTPPGGRLLYQLAGHATIVSDIDITRDGKLVVTGAKDSTVKMWDVAEGELIHSMDLPQPVGFVMFLSDDQNLLASCEGGIVYLIDVQTSFVQTQYNKIDSDDSQDIYMPIGVCLDENNKEYLASMRNKYIDFWDIEGSTLIKSFPVNFTDWSTEHNGYNLEHRHLVAFVETVVYAGYRATSYHVLVMLGQNKGLTVPLFEEQDVDVHSAKPSFCPKDSDHISSLAISGDGSLVFACNGATGNIHLNKITDGAGITVVKSDKNTRISRMYMPVEGDVLYQASGVYIATWEPRTNKKFNGLAHPCKVRKAVGANYKTVATIAEDSIVRFWDTTLEKFENDLSAFTGKVKVGENADMSALQSQFDGMFQGIVGEEANMFDTQNILTKDSSDNYWTLPDSLGQTELKVRSRFFLLENNNYVVIVNDNLKETYSICLTIWELTHMACVRRLILPKDSIYIHTVYDDNTIVLSENRKIKLMDLKRFAITQVLQGKAPDDGPPIVLYIPKRKELITESRGGRYLKVYDPLGGEMKGELIPSTQGMDQYLSTAQHPEVKMKCLKANESATILAALYVTGTPIIYLWNLEERKVVYVVNGRSIFPNLRYDSISFTTLGDDLVIWKDSDKLEQTGENDVAIVSSKTGRSSIHAKRRKADDKSKTDDMRKIPILRQMERSYVQMIGVTKDNKAFILGEISVGSNANMMKTSSDQTTIATWCNQPKEKTLQYWTYSDNMEALGTFTPDQEVNDLALRPGSKEIIMDSSTGAVKLMLSNQLNEASSAAIALGEKMFQDIDLKLAYPRGGDEDFYEEEDDPDKDIDSGQ